MNHLVLNDKWNLFFHDIFDKNWSFDSYLPITLDIHIAHQLIALNESIPDNIIKNGMLFLFRSHIKPFWEDKHNSNGGYFSFKLDNSVVHHAWKSFVYALCGETLFKDPLINDNVNGISISPKKTFCIIKIWLNSCDYKEAEFTPIKYIDIKDTKFTPFSEVK